MESLKEDHPLVGTYRILRELMPIVTEAQGTGHLTGIYRQGNEEGPGQLDVGDYRVRVVYEDRLPADHPPIGGLVVQTGPEEFFVAGYGFGCQFQAKTPGPSQTHIQSVELGHCDDAGKWGHELWLNGDETGANWTARIPPNTSNEYLGSVRPMILRVKLYHR